MSRLNLNGPEPTMPAPESSPMPLEQSVAAQDGNLLRQAQLTSGLGNSPARPIESVLTPHQLGEASIMADSQNARRSASLASGTLNMSSMYHRALPTPSSRSPGRMGAGGLTDLASSASLP